MQFLGDCIPKNPRKCILEGKFNYARAGIIPYEVVDNEVYVFVGRWWDKEVISDFGGMRDREECLLETAARELGEETSNLISFKPCNYSDITHCIFTKIRRRLQVVLLVKYEDIPEYTPDLFELTKHYFPECDMGFIDRIRFKDLRNYEFSPKFSKTMEFMPEFLF